MKQLIKTKEQKLYTLRQLAVFLQSKDSTVYDRANYLGILSERVVVDKRKLYTEEHYLKLKQSFENYRFRASGYKVPEIIYVTRTTEIYQSKLNFLTLEQL